MEQQSIGNYDIQYYLILLWRRAWFVVLSVLIAGVVAYFVSLQITPVYQATTTLMIDIGGASGQNTDLSVLTYGNRINVLVSNYNHLMTSDPVLDGVIEELDINISRELLKSRITVNQISETQFVDVSVKDPDRVRAANIVNAIGAIVSRESQSLQAQRYTAAMANLGTQVLAVEEKIRETRVQLESLSSVEGLDASIEKDQLETSLALNQENYTNLLQSIEQIRLAEIESLVNVVQVGLVDPPVEPISPSIPRNTLFGILGGLVFSASTLFLMELLDDKIKGLEDIKVHLNIPILGAIPRIKETEGDPLPITLSEPRTPISEAFRALRTNIRYASVDKPLHTILITSPAQNDGKTTVSTNLGIVLAQSGQRVVLIDADLRRPTVHKRMGMPNRHGLSNLFVQGEVHLNGMLNDTSVKGFSVMSAGKSPPNPSELVGSEKMLEVLNHLKKNADIILLDSSPLLVTDAVLLAGRVDGVLLVVKTGHTELAAAKQALEQLHRVGANILGVVVNDIDKSRSRNGRYYGSYGTYQSEI